MYRLPIRLAYFLVAAAVVGGCSNPSDSDEPEPDPALGPKPVLRNLGVNFDVAFTVEGFGKTHYKFLDFGFEVRDFQGELKALPHFTYTLDRSIEIISPMKGYVLSIDLQELSDDYSIWLKPHGDPTVWLVEFDHVTQLKVSKGDDVEVGDILGYPGGRGTLGTVELMVNGPDAHVCPFEVFSPDAATEMQGKLAVFMAAWDAAKWTLPENNIYHPNFPNTQFVPYADIDMVVPGCRVLKIPYPVE